MQGYACYQTGFLLIFVMMQPLPTKLVLRKKRAQEGRSGEEVEHFPVPSKVTLRKRPEVAAIELKDGGGVLPWLLTMERSF